MLYVLSCICNFRNCLADNVIEAFLFSTDILYVYYYNLMITNINIKNIYSNHGTFPYVNLNGTGKNIYISILYNI